MRIRNVFGCVLSALLIGTAQIPAAEVPYFADFENGVGSEWSSATLENSEAYFTKFTGRFGNNTQSLTVSNLTIGVSYTVGFDFYVIDSWDGNAGAGDYLVVNVNSNQVFRETFSNYNGNPPSSPQSFFRSPDEGRAQFGFHPSYVDSVYRNVEVVFVASNSTAVISFNGQNLGGFEDESWGIDNVSVNASSALTTTTIRSATLPTAGSTDNNAIENFVIYSSRPLLASTAGNSANYSLREASINGVFGDGDDVIFALTPSFATGRAVSISISNSPLQPGKYRFQTAAGLLDTNSSAVAVFTRDFNVAHPILGKIENASNDTQATATPLPTTESPAGSSFFTASAVGTFSSTSDVDYWRFDAEAGDQLTVRVEASQLGVYPQLYLHNAAGQNLRNVSGNYEGVVSFQNFVITSPGTYYLRVFSNNAKSPYKMRVDQSRGIQLETEANDATGTANGLNLVSTFGLAQGKIVGALVNEDSSGDYVKLRTLNVGNAISANAFFPTGSALSSNTISLSVYLAGNPVAMATNLTGSLNYTVISNGVYYVRVESTNRAIRAQYLLDVTLTDGVAPAVTDVNFPAQATTSENIIDRFTLTFSEEMTRESVTNSTSYSLRAAGSDGSFDTSDDQIYSVTNDYSGGLAASFGIPDGPLQPGNYRFTANSGLLDLSSNPLNPVFSRMFSVSNSTGFPLENRSNNIASLGTSLSLTPGTNADGTVSFLNSAGVGSRPQFVAAGYFDNDTNLDLATANWNGDNVSILLNSGPGIFETVTNIATGDGALGLAVGDFNNDSKTDLAVANYNEGSVSLLIGNGAGAFQVFSNYTGFSSPYNLSVADLNSDGKLDLVVPNYGNGNLSVLLGNGNGTFQTKTNYAVGSNPECAAIGDLNNDGKLDIVVANYSSTSISLLFGNGNGSFQSATNVAIGRNPRSLVASDINGDGTNDLVVLQSNDNTVGVLRGNGDGTFQERIDYNTTTSDAYQVLLADLNADGRPEAIVPGYGNNQITILMNDGAGLYTTLHNIDASGNPISAAAGDFNRDGRIDVAFANYNNNNVTLWIGNHGNLLTEDPLGSGLKSGTARGNLSSDADVDFYQFSGTAGDLVSLAVDVPGNPANSSLRYRIENPDGTILTQFTSDNTGWGQSSPLTLPLSGTYMVRVSLNNDFQGEYRLRITTARPPTQLETEVNNSLAQASKPSLTLTNGSLKAAIVGYLSRGDDNGDYYNLGNLGGNSVISLGLSQPVSSGFAGVIQVYNALGTNVATSSAGATNLVYTVPTGQDGIYYARLTMGTRGYSTNQESVLRLDGFDDSVDFGTWFNYQDFTISMWLNAGAPQVGFADILDNNHNTGINWVIQQNSSTENNYLWGNSDGSPNIPFTLPANQWSQLTITRDSSGTNRLYLNGVLVGSASGTGPVNYNGNQFLRLARWGGGGRNWNGIVDELRIWNKALTATEVAANVTGTLAGNEPGLVGYWRFNEGTGTTASDSSSSGRTGTLVNDPTWSSVTSSATRSAGVLAQYLFNIDLQDAQAPIVTGDTLPVNGTNTSSVVTRFNVSFNEEMDPAFNRLNLVLKTFGGHTYLITDSTGSWQAMQAQAVARGGNLVTINSQAENDFVNQNYSSYGSLWIGLSDFAVEGKFVWASGEPLSYTNWSAGEPNNSSGEDFTQLISSGRWNDIASGNLRGVIEVSSSTDSDADGIVNALDPYANDALNGFDLRAAGTDGLFDTSDDLVYNLDTTGYVNGLSAGFVIVNGPLQPGNYRFMVTTAVKDRSGNSLSVPYVRNFTIVPVSGLKLENQNNDSPNLATSLSVNPSSEPDGSVALFSAGDVGANPYHIVAGNFGGDTNLDLVTANYNSDSFSLLVGNGNGTFQPATNFTAGDGPIAIATGQFNADSNLDVAVVNESSSTVSVFFGNGAAGFVLSSNYNVGTRPRMIVSGDFNGDGRPDLATANLTANTVSVLLASTNGAFLPRVDYPMSSGTHYLAMGDLNGDGRLDLVAVNYNANTLGLLFGNADGTFQAQTTIPAGPNPRAIVIGKVNNDSILDLVVYNAGDNSMSWFAGNGNGTFQPPVNFTGGLSDVYQLVLADINSDGTNDLVIPSYGNNDLITMLNNGDGTFAGPASYDGTSNPISAIVADLNGDGRPDIATANYNGRNTTVYLGNRNSLLVEDPIGSGIRTGAGRGNLSDISDWDYWSFTGNAGDRISVACDVPGNPGASGLYWQINRPDGANLTTFYSDYRGWGQSPVAVLPLTGTYTVRVTYNYEYYNEYQLRVTVARPPTQMESEGNDSVGAANTLTYAFTAGHQKASVLGYISFGDGNGDYFRLGNLSFGTRINLNASKPTTSPLTAVLGIYNSAGTLVTNSAPGATNLVFDIPLGGDGSYFARVTASSGTGLFSQYLLDIDLADTVPPSILSDNLPGEGSTISNIVDRFSLNFSEDMTLANVRSSANYELRNAGADNAFGTSDDTFYGITNSPLYSSGLSANYLVTDGPLQPGKYRFTARTNLNDRAGNPLTNNYVRNFTLVNVAGYVFESRTNDSHALATSLSVTPTNLADGSFIFFTNTAVGALPYYLAKGQLNGDSNLDLVVANFDGANVSVLTGNGNGTFQTLTNYATGAGSISPVLGKFNEDSALDLAVANYSAGTVTVLLGNGDGTFQSSSNYSVGTQPYTITTGDFNADGVLDLATPNVASDNISVLLGNGDGTFQARVNYPAGDGAHFIVAGDINGDNKLDLLTANANSDNFSLFFGNGNGTFAPMISIAANQTPNSIALADLNNDGKLDIASVNTGDNTISVLFGNGDGSFQPRVNFAAGTSDSYHIVASDLNADGWKDLIVGGYNNSVILVFLNRQDGTFEPAVAYAGANRPIGLEVGDFNNDGRMDIAAGNRSGNNVTVLLGADTELLAQDGSIQMGTGRGNVSSGSDADYWSFSAKAGDRLLVTVETPGAPSSSSLRYLIHGPNGVYITDFYGDGNGRGQRGLVLSQSGTYSIRVEQSQSYAGEYRLRVTLAKDPAQVESEDNNSVGQANPISLPLNAGHQIATVLGAIASGDPGDYFKLGNLGAGTVIRLNYTYPQSSPLIAALKIYNSAGTAVATSTPGVTNLTFAVSAADQYFAQISGVSGAGLMSIYFLNLDVSDAVAPGITDVTLPSEGTTSTDIIDRFGMSFNKDLDPAFNALNRPIQFYNGHAYLLSSVSTSWLNSESEARTLGGHLVTINDAAENTWVRANFSGDFWIGLTDESQEGTFVWNNGEALSYTNWSVNEPNNSGNEDYAVMVGTGRWNDLGLGSNYRGLIEINGSDLDGDQLPDSLDPYPLDPKNVFDLRSAGTDGILDTGDDQVYRLTTANYTSGLSLNFTVVDGPLQAGNYRFRITSSLRDKFGNGLASAYDRYFSIGSVPYFTLENRTNNSIGLATSLTLAEELSGLKTAGARGNVANGLDIDYWSFTAMAGDLLMLATENPGNPGGSQLYYQVFRPDGTRIFEFYPNGNGFGQTTPMALPTNGTYTVAVSQSQSYTGEYRFRLTIATPPFQIENEDNGSIGGANAMTLAVNGDSRFGSMVGYVRNSTDNDYINLGTLTNGSTVFLSVRQSGSSQLIPVVSIYNSANVYQTEAGSGRASDGVAEVRITQTGTYYAVVRGAEGVSGLNEQYILDVQVLPTGSVSFPNLQVVTLNPPSGSGIQSGDPITFSFTVQNVGSLATPAANWSDRVVMSLNTVLGDTDDIPLGVYPHSGALNPSDSYTVVKSATLPPGINGNYYVIVQTDFGNAVNEFILEGDNVTVSSSTFAVARAPYPDLRVENLLVNGPDSNHVYSISWTTANRGNLAAPAGFRETLLVRNQTSGAILLNTSQDTVAPLAIAGTLARNASVTTTNPGNYLVQVTTDSRDDVYEFDATSHASAEQNTFTANFQIIQYFTIATVSNPTNAATLTGSGIYPSGATVSLTATANTNQLPYSFVNWTENGTFQSASTNFTFTATRNRQLIANFVLPSYQIAASNNPSGSGLVTGAGTYFYGTTNVLTAYPNPGYRFTNWTENSLVLGTNSTLTTVVYSNRFVIANYVEANPFHDVTTATLPLGLASVSGAGHYTNGQTGQITAPLSITNPPSVYTFKRFTLNGANFGTNASFSKTFSTVDPTNMQFIAEYDAQSILPLVTNLSANFSSPIPLTTNYVLTFQFNRSMTTSAIPTVLLTNTATSQQIVRTNGVWSSTVSSNDTFAIAPVTFSPGMDGTFQVFISGARDLNNGQLASTNLASVVVDATAPANASPIVISSNAFSALISWTNYNAPGDLSSFRVYLQTNNFSSVAGLTPLTGLNSATRQYQFGGLTLDTRYYVAVVAVDVAGNSTTTVTPLQFVLPSTVPPAVSIQVSAAGSSSASITWSGYNASSLLGFAGFRLFYEETNFTSVAALTVRSNLASFVRAAQVDNLDRAKTYYFAVVGLNATNGFNPSVTTASWSDPYAGTISANTTIGGGGQSEVAINQSIVVTNNAILTIVPGTTLRFASGTGITIQQGRLVANGTALDPIVFTSANDVTNQTPAASDWNGIVLNSGAANSILRHIFVKYGAGLTLNGVAPTLDAYTALYNTPNGLSLANGASVTTSDALLQFNGIGAKQSDTAQLNLRNSVLKANGTNAFAAGSATLVATQNWWGTTVSGDIGSHNIGTVNSASFLTFEPILTPAIGTVGNITQTGSRDVNLRFACRTADAMRVSEDSSFAGVFFAPFASQQSFQLSDGGGQKTVFAQFRSVTGQTNAPVSVSIQYLTAGPVIQSFSLNEGQTLSRPLTVNGSASAALGMASIEFYLDNVLQNSVAGGSYSQRFDVRNLSSGTHRVKLLARDNSGNFSTLERNVFVTVTPPPAPVISVPASNLIVTTNKISISGTAESLVDIRVTRNGQVIANTAAATNGTFAVTNISLLEGQNSIVATAFDSVGEGASAPREVMLDSGAPAQLIMDPPSYRPNAGLDLMWKFPDAGERASRFQLFWHTAPFATTNQASGQSLSLNYANYTVQGLANGTYYFGVVGFDGAGNASPLSQLVSFNYDGAAPTFNVTYDRVPPLGVGPVQLTLNASEALSGNPSLTLTPFGSSTPVLIPLTNTALTTYEGSFNVTSATPSGRARLNVTAQDLSSNAFNGTPTGADFVIDVTSPTGFVTTAPVGPVQTATPTNVTVSLTLSEAPKSGTTPSVVFTPPLNSPVTLTLSGAGTNWTAPLTLNGAMGSGFGRFALSVQDSIGNLGTNLTSGATLEIYNTAVPTAPASPTNLVAQTLSGGNVRLTWNAISNAEIYRLYREPGTNAVVPTLLVADNLTSNSVVDLPAADGGYRYAVSASRRGSESGISNLVVAVSDRTPPLAPTNVTAQLVSAGIQISWQQATNGEAVSSFRIYRNGTLIRTVNNVAPVIDAPPRGVMSYVVASADAAGNESASSPASIELLVGAVNNLQALVDIGQAPVLSWASSDGTAVGFNVYRNGSKVNGSLITTTNFTDTQYSGSSLAQYAVRAVNSTNSESAPRTVDVHRVEFGFLINPAGSATNNSSAVGYFDQYRAIVSNLTATGSLPLRQLEIRRTISGVDPLNLVRAVNQGIAAGSILTQDIIAPSASVLEAQTLRLRAVQETDLGGSSVIYEQTVPFTQVNTAPSMVEVYANQMPLAGGLSAFQVRVYNRGFADMDFVTTRNNGSEVGDVYISVKNAQGQEVSRTEFNGTPSGATFLSDGRGFVRITPGSSVQLIVPNVLVPASLASNLVTFEAVVGKVYYHLDSADQLQSGPLSGSMISSLSETEYYGTLQTDAPNYPNDTPIVVTGQAINRVTGLPKPNAALKIGFATRGYRWYRDVTTDSNGNYTYTYNPTPGLSGTLTLWAAHPLVFDALNQAQINIYRLYASPPRGDVRMSKNDTFNFSITLVNPGDLTLTNFTSSFRAYTLSGTNQTPISSIIGAAILPSDFGFSAKQTRSVSLQLTASNNAPDNAVVEFTLTSGEGASATFVGNVSLLPAVPVVTVVAPTIGYVETSLDRGTLVSRTVTIANRGLKALQGIELTPPTNVLWMNVNLPISPDGKIRLPDLGVGESNSFQVVFVPPAETPLDYYQDSIRIRGTNAVQEFSINLFALVTSDKKGSVQFHVDNILGQNVSNAVIRLRNIILQTELPPAHTDADGLVSVTNLQEGQWSWQASAPGHSSTVGSVEVIPNQIVQVDTRLSKSLVTVTFQVVPVPFTDKYEIKIEQTFETHVPAPVLVLDPSYREFRNVTPGFEANFIVTAKNYGLIEVTDVQIHGSSGGGDSLTPLITYFPVLLPQQVVEVPFRFTHDAQPAGQQGERRQFDGGDLVDCIGGGLPSSMAGFLNADVARGLGAIFGGEYHCVSDQQLAGLQASLAVVAGIALAADVFTSSADFIAAYVGNVLSCIAGNFLSAISTGISGTGTPGPRTEGIFDVERLQCFVAGTPVTMADGTYRPIEKIKIDDLVRTGLRSMDVATVAEVYSRHVEQTRELKLQTPARTITLRTTDEHLIWVDGSGWIGAGMLKAGDWLFTEKGERVKVIASRAVKKPTTVYTFQNKGDSAFYANGILVHDMCGVDRAQGQEVNLEVTR